MAYEIRWTTRARDSHGDIVAYLQQEWTEREIINFINAVEEKLRLIAIYPDLFIKTHNKSNVHKTVISKQVVLFYRKRPLKQQVELMVFWYTRRNPEGLKL